MKRLMILPMVLMLLTVLAACGSDSDEAPEVNRVSYIATDYQFSGPDFLTAGMTKFTLVNDGQELHH